ncbi:DUF4099 domain-containing protein [Dysgonomonas sp. UBA7698]|uniref:DUF4099 domain-containing protein n=1 Tax=Dysgonomonas sp. UBA7698 TaxID=1946427 RepID=UPI0025C5CC89|nr:DUF4099 domain-containing protein [Dysgonomonas sp. UBA7698]
MSKKKFKIEDINWDEMYALGISPELLTANGAMDTFLEGEITNPLNLDIVLLGNELNIDATLQLTGKGESPVVNIVCINKDDYEIE